MTPEELAARGDARRVDLLTAGVDLLAFETIPCRAEAVALRLRCCVSGRARGSRCCCRDDARLSSGEAVDEVVRDVERSDAAGQIEALGVNCTKPRYVSALVRRIRALTERPIVVYPNAGESFDAATGRWVDDAEAPPQRFAALAEGGSPPAPPPIGGCCRTGPAHIAAVPEGGGRGNVNNKTRKESRLPPCAGHEEAPPRPLHFLLRAPQLLDGLKAAHGCSAWPRTAVRLRRA